MGQWSPIRAVPRGHVGLFCSLGMPPISGWNRAPAHGSADGIDADSSWILSPARGVCSVTCGLSCVVRVNGGCYMSILRSMVGWRMGSVVQVFGCVHQLNALGVLRR